MFFLFCFLFIFPIGFTFQWSQLNFPCDICDASCPFMGVSLSTWACELFEIADDNNNCIWLVMTISADVNYLIIQKFFDYLRSFCIEKRKLNFICTCFVANGSMALQRICLLFFFSSLTSFQRFSPYCPGLSCLLHECLLKFNKYGSFIMNKKGDHKSSRESFIIEVILHCEM